MFRLNVNVIHICAYTIPQLCDELATCAGSPPPPPQHSHPILSFHSYYPAVTRLGYYITYQPGISSTASFLSTFLNVCLSLPLHCLCCFSQWMPFHLLTTVQSLQIPQPFSPTVISQHYTQCMDSSGNYLAAAAAAALDRWTLIIKSAHGV